MGANKFDDYMNMGKVGNFTGIYDQAGMPIHLGDTLEFDSREWGGVNIFQLLFEDGELSIGFGVGDLTEFCTVIKKWNE